MVTTINLYDHTAGLRRFSVFCLPRDVVICRLQKAIGEPDFTASDEDVSVYARIDTDPITLHIFGCSYNAPGAAARWNEIRAELGREAVS